MSKLELRELTIEDESAFINGYEDWKNEDITWYSFIWKPGSDYKEHLKQLVDCKDKSKLAENRVPSTMLYAFVNDEIVGRLSIRHELNNSLLERGGHIGYSVSPRLRGNGYATEIFKQGLIYCNKLGLKNILVTCADQNIPSWKIIEKFASHLENRIYDSIKNEYVRRYWVDVQKSLSNNFKINQKVVIYLTRRISDNIQLLVFDHDEKFKDAGTQVIAGSIDANESEHDAALREIEEESGINAENLLLSKIDEYLFFSDLNQKYYKRHVYHCELDSNSVSEKWTHQVSGHGEDSFLNFHFYWQDLELAKNSISVRLGDSLFKINARKNDN